MENKISAPINVLHVSLEAGPAVFGGLGRVATQMLDAQNRFQLGTQPQFNASIITPFYPQLYSNFADQELIAEVAHLYNNTTIKSKIYLTHHGDNKYYLVEPPIEYKHLFNINSKPEIYADLETSSFIERVKFFNSVVAAYVNNPQIGSHHPQPQILQLHDWQAALVPELLRKHYKNTSIKSVFMVHIDSGDRGTYPSKNLQGIGLDFNKEITILKAIGLMAADKIVAVSPKFLRECIETRSDDPELEFLRKIFTLASVQNKTVGISNGINYADFCPLGKQIHDATNIYQEKLRLKQDLSQTLRGTRLTWKFDPNLRLILYVGRYSPEKGPEAFEQVIKDSAGRATFVAVGRGMTDDVFRVLIKHSRQTDNVFVTASEIEQADLLEKLRAAADIILIPSHRDAFGLVGPEGLANGGIIVTTGAGGLKGITQRLNYTDKDHTTGNGIFYADMLDGGYNPALKQALDEAIGLWQVLNPQQINAMQTRIMQEAQQFDWCAPNGSLQQYLEVYQELLSPPQASKTPKLRLYDPVTPQ